MLTPIGTSEFQKKRDEHVHMQGIIQCKHTSSSLHEIANAIEQASKEVDLVADYKRYHSYVCKQGYASADVDAEARYVSAEKSWPNHAKDVRLAAIPTYLGQKPPAHVQGQQFLEEGRSWLREHYWPDFDHVVEQRQELSLIHI